MSSFYQTFAFVLLPLHILSAMIWIGVMIGYVFTAYPAIKQIPNEKLMVRTSLRTLRKVLPLTLLVSLTLFATGLIMAYGNEKSVIDPLDEAIINTKEALWIFMVISTVIAYFKTLEAKKKCLASDSGGAKDNVRLISNYIITVNIFLGLIAAYFGLMLRG